MPEFSLHKTLVGDGGFFVRSTATDVMAERSGQFQMARKASLSYLLSCALDTSTPHRVQRDMLYRSGLIAPRIRASEYGAADQFAPADLDAFLDRLLDGAKPLKVARAGRVKIPEAARLAFCMSSKSSD